SENQANYHVNVPAVQDDGTLAQQVNAEIGERVDAHLAEAKQMWEEYHEAFLSTGGTEAEWSQREMEVIVNYEVKSQTDTTVSFVVNQFVGTFNAYNEQYFYNLNLTENRDITLKDLLGEDWVALCNAEIQTQIDASADADGFTYFFPAEEGGFATVDETTSFYIDQTGNPVVVFPRYSIAAGAAGATEFPISK
ncbi:MAG: RsiV family protein, partial [Pseudoflavonifractor sp.]